MRRVGQHPAAAKPEGLLPLQPAGLRQRNLVERYFNKLKQFRGVAMRCDRLPENWPAAIKLAAVRIWLGS